LLERFGRWWKFRANETGQADDPLAGQVEALLAELDPAERRLIEGKYLEGESVKELAIHSGLTEKAVEARLSRLRQRLRERFLQLLRSNEPS
jgi:RNA polymerase sigma factor (sigma-70 family)